MKVKNFIKRKSENAGANARQALGTVNEELNPVIKKVGGKFSKIKEWGERKPGTAFVIMMVILVLNFGLLFLLPNKNEHNVFSMNIPDVGTRKMGKNQGGKDGSGSLTMPNISYSFQSIRKMKRMRDTLQYLMGLKHMTYADTVTFVKIMDEFQEMTNGTDPDIEPISIEKLREMGNHSPSIENNIPQH